MTFVAMHLRKMPASNGHCTITLCISTYFQVRDFSIPQDILVGAFSLISIEGHKDFGNRSVIIGFYCFD